MELDGTCIVCGSALTKCDEVENGRYFVDCPRCKTYRITKELVYDLKAVYDEKQRNILTCVVRNLNEQDFKVDLNTNNIQILLDSVHKPDNPLEKMDIILNYIYRKSRHAGEGFELDRNNDYPIAFAKNPDEFEFFIRTLKNMRYVEILPARKFRLTYEGLERLYQIIKDKIPSNQAFVALWLDVSMKDPYEKGIKKALEETGYDPYCVGFDKFNDNIVNRIIAEIQRSAILVADFTGDRGGVYYEAGYAKGLGRPVIYCCKNIEAEKEKLHFDTKQIQHLFWNDPDDLYIQLVDQIEATLPHQKKNKKS